MDKKLYEAIGQAAHNAENAKLTADKALASAREATNAANQAEMDAQTAAARATAVYNELKAMRQHAADLASIKNQPEAS